MGKYGFMNTGPTKDKKKKKKILDYQNNLKKKALK